jgi:hypothetical protein
MADETEYALPATKAFVDGISSIATHNDVHRIVCYTLTADGKPAPCVELLIPSSGIKNFADAITALSH